VLLRKESYNCFFLIFSLLSPIATFSPIVCSIEGCEEDGRGEDRRGEDGEGEDGQEVHETPVGYYSNLRSAPDAQCTILPF
jgi:hypothetical protein